MEFNFKINGNPVTVDVDPMMPLLWVVRDELGLKGTKYGCGRAMCGACSLHVDGDLFRSCSYPVKYAEGKEVTTLEGLTAQRRAADLQDAFLRHNALQCGFCTPGMLASALSYIEAGGSADRTAIRAHLSGNYCRCTGYQAIVDAVVDVIDARGQA